MAGKRIGDHQVGIYKKLRTKHGQEVAAAKTGISVRSARRIDASDTLPSQREARSWRTRTDPFEAVWESELVPMLVAAPALTATTLLEEIQRRYPGLYDAALLRTLQRPLHRPVEVGGTSLKGAGVRRAPGVLVGQCMRA